MKKENDMKNGSDTKFCPIIKSECCDNCVFLNDGECICAEGMRGLLKFSSMLDAVDYDAVAKAFEFFATLNEAPIYQSTKDGSIPWLRVVAAIEED